MISAGLRKLVKERASDRCEYCGLHQDHSILSLHVEHIIPKQHGGASVLENLALACPGCNLHKGPNLTGIDPDTRETERLFHPRQDIWQEHFQVVEGRITGQTAIGRTTVWALAMNDEDQVCLRSWKPGSM
jgi:5-methylcytosine-specific restriction endonuclease McrA